MYEYICVCTICRYYIDKNNRDGISSKKFLILNLLEKKELDRMILNRTYEMKITRLRAKLFINTNNLCN